MRHLTLFPTIVLSLGLLGCDSSSAGDAADARAAGPAVAEVPAAPPASDAPAPTTGLAPDAAPVRQDGTPDGSGPPATANPGRIRRGQAARPPQTLAQMQARTEQMFVRLDADSDGAITSDELAVLTGGAQGARVAGQLREMITRADADGNARITLEELRNGTARRFARLDADGDGVVTDEERPDRP